MKKKKGFTLVELLAVIVILAVILIIAMPRISDVINNSKKSSFEATAKLIASQAEKKYTENQVLDGSGAIKCSDVVKLNDRDYGACTITFDASGNASVSINGSGKFAGLTIKNATKNSATATELTATDAKYFSYEILDDGLTDDGSKIYDVTVVDKPKCITYFKNYGETEDVATTICSGGRIEVDGYFTTLSNEVKNDYIPETDYETAGLKVDIYNKTKNVTVADQNKCVTYFKNHGETEDVATTICSGGRIEEDGYFTTLSNEVKNDYIPETDYETAGLKVKDVYKVYDVTVADQNKCVTYSKNVGHTEEVAMLYCTNVDMLTEIIEHGGIPESDYETVGLKVTSKIYDKISITGYNTEGGLDVVIPSEIDVYKVYSIGNNAFSNEEIKSVVIPDTVKTIGYDAFKENPNMVITNNSSIENIQDVWDKILGIYGACSPEVTITNNIIEIGEMPPC